MASRRPEELTQRIKEMFQGRDIPHWGLVQRPVALDLVPAGSSVESVARLYERRYAGVSNGLFSQHNGTPLLDAFVESLYRNEGALVALEVGAGQGLHAGVIASRIPDVEVIAIDTSQHAIDRINQRLPEMERLFADGTYVIPVQADVFSFLRQRDAASVHGIHANSFGHFFSDDVRAEFYDLSYAAQPSRGLLAVSQKDRDDALLHLATTRVIGEDEKGIRAIPEDGIERLFYRSPEAAADEMRKAGYVPKDVFQWRVGGYDFPKQSELEASFVGVLAQKG